VAEERREPPFEGGSQPVSHERDPLPGPGTSVARWATFAIAALVLAGVLIYAFGRL
jgi:hypothetical protein